MKSFSETKAFETISQGVWAAAMIDDRREFTKLTEQAQIPLPPPAVFDESASANARPVQPLPTNRVALSSQSARDAWPGVSARAITLTLAIIAALAIGAVSGAMLVKHQESTETSSDIQEASAITTEESDLSDGNSAPPDDNGSQSIPMAAQGTVGAAPRLRRHRVVEEGRASNARIGLL